MNAAKQLIYLEPKNLDKSIYRIMSCQYLLQVIETGENRLVHPSRWDDPFENLILKSTVRLHDGTTATFGFRNHVFAQCWSLHRETDLMWRVYSPHKDGVKIKTSVNTLITLLMKESGPKAPISCFIGRVKYMSKKRIEKHFDLLGVADSSGRGIAETLLVKRSAFKSENEVRLVYIHNDSSIVLEELRYSIDPNELFEELVLDPRMEKNEYQKWETEFRKRGYNGKITQSDLYAPPRVLHLKNIGYRERFE